MSNISPLNLTHPAATDLPQDACDHRVTIRLTPAPAPTHRSEVRESLVQEIRRQIAEGEYETDQRLSRTVDALWQSL